MSLHPARDEAEARKQREAIELCGKNRGPHEYVAIEKLLVLDPATHKNYERVTRFLCLVCFNNVETSTLLEMYKDVSIPQTTHTAL